MRDNVQTFGKSSTAMQWSTHTDSTADASTDLERRQPHRAATSPASSSVPHQTGPSPYPPSLYPGQKPPQTIHRNDIFFSPGMNYTRYDPYYAAYAAGNGSAPAAAQFYPQHQQQYFHRQQPGIPVPPKPPALQQEFGQEVRHAPLHPSPYRSFTSPPPLPPKPSYLFEPEPSSIPTSAYLGASSQKPNAAITVTATPPATSSHTPGVTTVNAADPESDDDGDDLAVALALSKDESVREEERLNELARQEEEELTRALAASMTLAENSYNYSATQPEAGPSNRVPSPPSSLPPPATTAGSLHETASESSSAGDSDLTKAPRSSNPVMPNQPPLKVEDAATPGNEQCSAAEKFSVGTRALGGVPLTPDEELPSYTPNPTDRTPTNETFSALGSKTVPPAPTQAAHANDDDEDGEELPYLRTEGRQTPVPPTASSEVAAEGPASMRPSSESTGSTENPTFTSSSTSDYDAYISEDEALARRLAEEEEAAYLESRRSNSDPHTNSFGSNLSRQSSTASTTAATMGGNLPSYSDAVSIASTDDASVISSTLPDVRIELAPSESKHAKGDLSRNSSINSSLSISSAPVPTSSSAIPFPSNGLQSVTLRPDEQRVIGRVSSMSALRPNDTSPSNNSLTPSPSPQPTLHLSLIHI